MQYRRMLIIDTLIMGLIGALSAQLFTLLLKGAQTVFLYWVSGYTSPGLPHEGGPVEQVIGPQGLWLIPLVTTLGGLISGILVYSLAPEAEGHGTDTAVKAFHRLGGYIRPRVAPLKMIASAITIGSGGSAGREGPTALISSGIGSFYAKLFNRSDEERRLLVIVGMAAGLSAIFRSPIGTAIFAIEVLYSDMEFEVGYLFYVMLGSIIAYAINGVFVGWQPLFLVPAGLTAPDINGYAWYALLGIVSGIVATILPTVFYGLRDIFHKLPVPPHIKPAIGGLCVGLMALELPQVLGGGYGWIQKAIDGQMTAMILFTLIFAKMLSFALTVSSGGSGGVFAPSLYVGAMVGGLTAKLMGLPPAAFVIVGMAAVFSGAARVPMATLLMVTEMTGGYRLLAPAGLAVMLSYYVQSMLSNSLKYRSLYEAQVPGRSDSPAHHVEHIRIALDLIDKAQVKPMTAIGHLDLLALMRSGIAVDLSRGKQLIIGDLRAESPWVGAGVRSIREGKEDDMEIVAIIRAKEMLLPHPDMILQEGDRIVVIVSQKMKKEITDHLASL